MIDRCRIGALVAALVVLSGCGADQPGGAASQHRAGNPPSVMPATTARGASVRQRLLAREFSVFRRARTQRDAVPGAKATITSPGGTIYLSEARRIASAEGKSAWLAPSDSGVCLVFAPMAGRPTYSSINCRTLAEARRGQLVAVQPGPPVFVQGVAADSVTSVTANAGRPVRTAVIDNGYGLDLWHPSSLRLTDASGRAIGRVRLTPRQRGAPDRAAHGPLAPPRAPSALTQGP